MTRAAFPGMFATCWGHSANFALTVGAKGASHGISCIAIRPTWVETPMMENAFDRITKTKGITRDAARAEISVSSPQGRIVQTGEVATMVDFFCSEAAPCLTNVDIQINAGADL